MPARISALPKQDEFHLQALSPSFRAIRLACRQSFDIDETAAAYVCGIRIAESRIEGSFHPGDVIEFPIEYLPWVELPADIHLVNQRTGEDICQPIPIRTYDQAIALIGLGDVEIENLTVDQGILRGTAINRTNGLSYPQMFVRINGLVPRTVSVESPRLLETGGASFQFATQLHPSDLVENGLTADIFLVGMEVPLASIAYSRADVDDMAKRVVELETELAQLKTAMAFKFNTQNSDVTARMDVMQQRIDTFIEYAASFMFDRVAAVEVPTQPGAPPLPAKARAKLDAFLDIVRGGAKPGKTTTAERVALDKRVPVALRSAEFSYGWYDVEEVEGREFRWMAADAILFNPQPGRPVRDVTIGVAAIYGADQPMVRASFDTKPATVTIERGDKKRGTPWLLRLKPQASKKQVLCQTLSLASLLAGSPAQSGEGSDSRILSIAVSEIVFDFAE